VIGAIEKWILCSAAYYAALVLALIWGLRKLKPGCNSTLHRVSVILSAHNEAPQIERCLAALTAQDYPERLREIILVNDRSDDATAQIMDKYCSILPACTRLDIAPTEMMTSPKKYALSRAIEKASGPILLFTDADCSPSPTWISEMVTYFEAGVAMTAGFSPLLSAYPSCWARILELDSLAAAAVAAGSIGLGSAVTCTGRNLAYTKDAFIKLGGFRDFARSLLSGDDDLLLQRMHAHAVGEIQYAIGPRPLVTSFPVTRFAEFIHQRRRHFSTGRYYSAPVQTFYFLYHLSNLVLFLGVAAAAFLPEIGPVAFLTFAGKCLLDFLLLWTAARKLYQCGILRYLIPWELYFILYNTLVGPMGMIRPRRWK